ncbi:hypothetical protein C8R46DRAFT_39915 [Mycena filopes]|nr:hypothetical protein C8R46DRAFT_39915 [Mycena filopes]
MGVLGTVASLGLLLWNCTHSLAPWIHILIAPSSPAPLLKRGMEMLHETITPHASVIKPIIPGVTVPLNHLPVILLAVFLSQLVHEFGHAVSAALDAVPILSAGASFTVVVPAAFVTFPSTALEALKPFARSRIIAAGPFHNLVFWGLLLLTDRAGVGVFFTRTLYRDVWNEGRVVVSIDQDSDLRGHLPIGYLITKLDDTSLASPEDRWTSYLSTMPRPGLGWCVDRAAYSESPQSCCEPRAHFSPLSCFVAVSSAEKGCIDAIPILTRRDARRCESDSECSDPSRCVRPDESSHILRLTVETNGRAQVVLWSGPLAEVHEQVEIGTFLPRFRLLPLSVYTSTRLIWDYLKMATLSLYLFNLLPLPYLDGSQLVQAVLETTYRAESGFDEYDVEALEAASTPQGGSSRNRRRWKEGLGQGITRATTCVFVLSALLALADIR